MELRSDGSPLGAEACWMSEVGTRDRAPEEASAEAALVARAVAGEPAAFEQLMVQNERRVLTLAWRLLGRMDEAQDAAQEVFLKAFRYLYRFDARKPLTPWLMRITVNVCRDLGRKRQSLPTTFSAMDKPPAESATTGPEGNPHDELAADERRQMLWTALDRLPNKERAAIVLRDLEGLSTEEVAALLKSSQATVRSQISSARLKIRKDIDRMRGTRP